MDTGQKEISCLNVTRHPDWPCLSGTHLLFSGRLRHDNPLSQSSKKTYYETCYDDYKTRKNLIKTFHIFIKSRVQSHTSFNEVFWL